MSSNKFKIVCSLTLALCIISASAPFAQDTSFGVSGIYMNSHDYITGKLSSSFDCKSSGKIKLHHVFASKYTVVISAGTKTRLFKDSIFGYHNCKNEDYRFYKSHDEEFRILENKDIIIYSSYVRASSPNGKKNDLVLTYFFSKTIDSEILPLTLGDLKQAFSENIKFQNLLDLEFKGGQLPLTYLMKEKMYEINYLLSKSKSNNFE
jgi:hypothetical protein